MLFNSLCNLVFEQIDYADQAVCGRTAEGLVRCWGEDAVEAPEGLRFVDISLSKPNGPICGIALDGSAICWGRELDRINLPNPELRFIQLSISPEGHQCGVTTDGRIECWNNRDLPGGRGPVYAH